MKGLKYNLTNNQAYIRNYVLSQARKMVMKQTNGLYPAPLKILEVCWSVYLKVRDFPIDVVKAQCMLHLWQQILDSKF